MENFYSSFSCSGSDLSPKKWLRFGFELLLLLLEAKRELLLCCYLNPNGKMERVVRFWYEKLAGIYMFMVFM